MDSFSEKRWAHTAEKILGEIWKSITDWPDYEVSNFGNVRRCKDTEDKRGKKAGELLSLITSSKDYKVVTLFKRGTRVGEGDKRQFVGSKKKQLLVHRLVMEAFYGPAPESVHVNHIDGNKENNKLSNLEYVTATGNMLHSYKAGFRSAKGEKNGQAKLTPEKVTEIRRLAHEELDWHAIADQFSITYYTVKHIVRRTRWDHVQDSYPPIVGRKTKLTEEQVLEIRKQYKKVKNYTKVAEPYGISAATVRDIILNKMWKHIQLRDRRRPVPIQVANK